MAKTYIGIDPGVKTGIAWYVHGSGKIGFVGTMSIIKAMESVRNYCDYNLPFLNKTKADVCVVFEDARQRKWIPREKSLSQFKGRAMGAGSVKRDCEIWEEFCNYYGIPYEKVPPRPGLTKWDSDTFKKVTGYRGRTSNHARDAALLVFGK